MTVPASTIDALLSASGDPPIVIVSPHLDDAAFSTCAVLLGPHAGRCTVATVFTAAPQSGARAWSQVSGFATPEAEFRARREEDARAMQSIGVRYLHLGADPAAFDEHLARAAVEQLGRALYLLPAAAGRDRLPSSIVQFGHRVLRRPSGAVSHGEHRIVRDAFTAVLRARDWPFAFYAEFPYLWNDDVARIAADLSRLVGRPVSASLASTDVSRKVSLANLYDSQAVPILGDKLAWRRRVLGRPEVYLTAI